MGPWSPYSAQDLIKGYMIPGHVSLRKKAIGGNAITSAEQKYKKRREKGPMPRGQRRGKRNVKCAV